MSKKLTLDNIDENTPSDDEQIVPSEGASVNTAPQEAVQQAVEEKPMESLPTVPVVPVPDPRTIAARQYLSDKQKTQKMLDDQPKVMVVIPLTPGEDAKSTHEVGYNGLVFIYPKNVMLNLPQPIAQLIWDFYKITAEVGVDKRLDRSADVTSALS